MSGEKRFGLVYGFEFNGGCFDSDDGDLHGGTNIAEFDTIDDAMSMLGIYRGVAAFEYGNGVLILMDRQSHQQIGGPWPVQKEDALAVA